MYIDFALAGVQTLLIGLKLTGLFDRSWWTVLLPSILWAVLGILIHTIGKDDEEK